MALLLRGKICIEREVFIVWQWLAPLPADRILMNYVTCRCDAHY